MSMAVHQILPDSRSLDLLSAATSCWGAQSDDLPQFDEAAPPTAPLLSPAPPRSHQGAEHEAFEALIGAGVCLPLDMEHLPSQELDEEEEQQQQQQHLCASGLPCHHLPGGHADGFSFSFLEPNTSPDGFHFPAQAQATEDDDGALKRIRHGLDVDGPNTADLGCKKRRLRTQLITSPLSQAYSQPATHILNREGQKHGDKRFLKMTTASNEAAMKRQLNVRATAFVRYSAMNRTKRRMAPMLAAVVKARQEGAGGGGVHASDGSTRLLEQEQWKPQSLTTVSRSHFPPQQIAPSTAPYMAAASTIAARAPNTNTRPILPNYNILPTQLAPPPPQPPPRPHTDHLYGGSYSNSNNSSSNQASSSSTTSSSHHEPYRGPPILSPEPPSDPAAYDEFDEVDFSYYPGHDEEDDEEQHSRSAYMGKGKEPMYPGGHGDGGPGVGGGGARLMFEVDPSIEEDEPLKAFMDELDGISWRTY